ncbi:MAG TPA: flagellar basal body P-ring formation chaperone FlgA [Bdellovibrionota bacterium]|jgi:flagella basal body P-ring formation protein FlgA|nr:flagellar basal body P-ring formation chaperone FlgA [Bdellovibrionota bacterium]
MMGYLLALTLVPMAHAVSAVKPNLEAEVGQKIEGAYRAEILSKTDAQNEEVRVHVSALQLRPMLDVREWKDVQVFGVGLSQGGMEGIFSLPVQITTADGRYYTANAYGTVEVIAPVYLAAQEIRANEIIEATSLRRQVMPWKMLNPGFDPLKREQILGRRAKARLVMGSALFSQVLDEPLAVKSGETVALTLISGPGVLIRSRAVAKASGRIGDRIKVLNPQTQKQMDVLVTADKEVELSL